MIPRALEYAGGVLRLLDQRRLPARVEWVSCRTSADVADAIARLVVRGAPAIGIAAAYGMALAARRGENLEEAAGRLGSARPTAVNLRWALERIAARAGRGKGTGTAGSDGARAAAIESEAVRIHREDAASCRRIGEHGLALLGDGPRLLTHCNAGALATGGIGTALAPVYLALERGRAPRVWACEARPVLQGARLTAWELGRAGVDVTLLVDAAAPFLLARGEVDSVWVGADRIAANGDVANKIGTYGLACAAARAGIPFYVAAPASTFDPDTPSGDRIPLEFRPGTELADRFSEPVVPEGTSTWTPAFDVTPAALVSAYVTDSGIRPGARGQSA